MRTLLCGVALSAAIAAPAMAETRYDRNLEKAVMGIVAGKIGDIRGGFSYKQRPQFVVIPDAVSAASVPAERPAQAGFRRQQRRSHAGCGTAGFAHHFLEPHVAYAAPVARQIIISIQTVEMIDRQVGDRLRRRQPDIDSNPPANRRRLTASRARRPRRHR